MDEIEWSVGREGYFFWDEAGFPIGYWPTKEEAELQREAYSAWLMSDQYPNGEWQKHNAV